MVANKLENCYLSISQSFLFHYMAHEIRARCGIWKCKGDQNTQMTLVALAAC